MSYRTIAHAAALAMSAGAGWLAHGPAAPDVPAPAVVRLAPALVVPSAAADSTPLIAVSSDGNVTLRVEQQPLEWVLEQIANQSGWADVKERARPRAAAGDVATAAPPPVLCVESTAGAPRLDAARVLHAIERGGEADRFAGLMKARSDGVLVPEQTLGSLYQTDASERVRVAAFESYLEQRADRREAVREALEAALYVSSQAVQREARQRLEELHEMERIDALSVQGDP